MKRKIVYDIFNHKFFFGGEYGERKKKENLKISAC